MFVNGKGSIWGILRWQWRPVGLFAVVAAGVVLLHHLIPWLVVIVELPSLPLAVVGGAIGIFVSFRTNSSYDRWWEGRKLWGRLVNTSRTWVSQVLTFWPEADGKITALQRELVYRHIAYVHTLRCVLRRQDPFADEDALGFFTEKEKQDLPGQSNVNHALLFEQLRLVTRECDAKKIDEFRHTLFDGSIRQLLDIQGGCERIKNTPFPRGYEWIAHRLIIAYGLLLPFGLVAHMGFWTVPITVLVCMSFLLISEVGRVLEDPFTMFWPALPLMQLSRMIEVNLRERLGDTDLPPLLVPDKRGVLM